MPTGDQDYGTCPNCGYCKHCGRGRQLAPVYPIYPMYPQPWITGPYWQVPTTGYPGTAWTPSVTSGTTGFNPSENVTFTIDATGGS